MKVLFTLQFYILHTCIKSHDLYRTNSLGITEVSYKFDLCKLWDDTESSTSSFSSYSAEKRLILVKAFRT